jgi:hypothetical protein
MTESTRRLWGIDVIAGIYGLATLALVWLCFNGTDIGRLFGMSLAPISAIISLGIAFRVNVVRVGLLIFLGIALVGDGLLSLFYAGALAGAFRSPPNKEPLTELMSIAFRVVATLMMFFYLKRPDVRDAFRRVPHRGTADDPGLGQIDSKL